MHMDKYRIFIDGNTGTTGLMIEKLLESRDDISLIKIHYDKRHDIQERLNKMHEADVSILCLSDQNAEEIAKECDSSIRLIDTSTCHRICYGWVYGMPELTADQRKLIASSNRVANPGCHASGFILLMKPLVDEGIIRKDFEYHSLSLTGYSGGGKKMISDYESDERPDFLESPGIYAQTQNHKHLPEMMKMTGIEAVPFFSPVVSDYFSGMAVNIPLPKEALTKKDISMKELHEIYLNRYASEALIEIGEAGYSSTIYGNEMAEKNGCLIRVSGNEERKVLSISYDNLRKGASGSAIQNLNLMLGIEETKGLI